MGSEDLYHSSHLFRIFFELGSSQCLVNAVLFEHMYLKHNLNILYYRYYIFVIAVHALIRLDSLNSVVQFKDTTFTKLSPYSVLWCWPLTFHSGLLGI